MHFDMTHDELAHNLAKHLMAENRMVWENIPAGKAGSIRPDVYTIEKSFAHPNPISYEIKVSKSDFMSDVTKGKWSGYLDFSYGVIFAVPKGLITKSELPDKCGLMTFNGEFWNTVKRPTMQPKELDTELLLKLLIVGEERQTSKDIIQPRDLDEWKQKDKLNKKFGKDFAEKISLISKYPSIKKEVDQWYEDLYIAIGKEDQYNKNDKYSPWTLRKLIKDTIESCDRQTYIDKLSKDLDGLETSIIRQISWARERIKS